jgi:hypothetical protein
MSRRRPIAEDDLQCGVQELRAHVDQLRYAKPIPGILDRGVSLNFSYWTTMAKAQLFTDTGGKRVVNVDVMGVIVL